MVEQSELRVGNFILFKGVPVEVVGISPLGLNIYFDCSNCDEGYGSRDEMSYEPILLTPIILEKCGFVLHEDDDDNKSYDHSNCPIDFQAEVGSNQFEQCNPMIGYKLIYLHQLQNLYYSLVGEELEIDHL